MSGTKTQSHTNLVINMPSTLKRKLKIQAAINNQTMTGFVNSLIEKEVTNK